MKRYVTGLLALAALGSAAPVSAAPSPRAVFASYIRYANAGDMAGLRTLIAPSVARPPNSRCAPALSDYDCMLSYLDETVVKRHSALTAVSPKVTGHTASAKVELRNDATRMAGIDRLAGTDKITVEHGKIVRFEFVRDESDPQTMKFFEFMMKMPR